MEGLEGTVWAVVEQKVRLEMSWQFVSIVYFIHFISEREITRPSSSNLPTKGRCLFAWVESWDGIED